MQNYRLFNQNMSCLQSFNTHILPYEHPFCCIDSRVPVSDVPPYIVK